MELWSDLIWLVISVLVVDILSVIDRFWGGGNLVSEKRGGVSGVELSGVEWSGEWSRRVEAEEGKRSYVPVI